MPMAPTTVLLAGRAGFPVSTTHALIGALLGASLLTSNGTNYSRLVTGLALPLLLTPIASLALTYALYTTATRSLP